MTPVELVQSQLDAHNAHDLDAFLATYSDKVQVFYPPAAQAALSGKKQFAEFYRTQRFNLPDVKVELISRVAENTRVIDHQRIFGVKPEPYEVAAVYEVVADLIETVWFYVTP